MKMRSCASGSHIGRILTYTLCTLILLLNAAALVMIGAGNYLRCHAIPGVHSPCKY